MKMVGVLDSESGESANVHRFPLLHHDKHSILYHNICLLLQVLTLKLYSVFSGQNSFNLFLKNTPLDLSGTRLGYLAKFAF